MSKHWQIMPTRRYCLRLVPYGVTCAHFARMFSSDLEGHAPSWPCRRASGRDRSASLTA